MPETQNLVYVNITSEGARLNPQTLDSEDHALAMFLMWRSNDTTMQAKVVGIETVKHYFNTAEGQKWEEEESLVIQFGPLLGYVPLSESAVRNRRQMQRYVGRYIAVIPDRFNPHSDGKSLLLFSRKRALELMQGANQDKITVGATWTGVIMMRTAQGYIVNIGGFRAWLPLSLVSYSLVKPNELQIGEMVEVKITERVRRIEGRIRTIVVSRRDATPNPYDQHASKYSRGGEYLAEVRVLNGRVGYATLPDGVTVRFNFGQERDALRSGTPVLVRINRANTEEKLFEGAIISVISQAVLS